MAMGFRPNLGMSLQNIVDGDRPPMDMGDFTPGQGMGGTPKKKGLFAQGSKGQMIAGIIGDTLASLSGGDPIFTMNMMRQREMGQRQEAEEAQWTRRREAERADKQWEWANKPPETPAMIRNAQAWQQMTPEQRKAYQEMQDAERGPFTVLPNGMAYVRDPAIAAQLGMPQAQSATPTAPVGKLTPIAGGPQARPAGPFRP